MTTLRAIVDLFDGEPDILPGLIRLRYADEDPDRFATASAEEGAGSTASVPPASRSSRRPDVAPRAPPPPRALAHL